MSFAQKLFARFFAKSEPAVEMPTVEDSSVEDDFHTYCVLDPFEYRYGIVPHIDYESRWGSVENAFAGIRCGYFCGTPVKGCYRDTFRTGVGPEYVRAGVGARFKSMDPSGNRMVVTVTRFGVVTVYEDPTSTTGFTWSCSEECARSIAMVLSWDGLQLPEQGFVVDWHMDTLVGVAYVPGDSISEDIENLLVRFYREARGLIPVAA